MKRIVTHSLLSAVLTSLCLMPLIVHANGPQVLQLDGKVRTKDISFEGVRMVVERNGITLQTVTENLKRFQLQLDLQQDYVLTFHREGCLSKSVHIDTHVPEQALAAAPYQFPFLVTLEPRPKGQAVRYAEPVGQVGFNAEKADFTYRTEYNFARERTQAVSVKAPQPDVPRIATNLPPVENAARKLAEDVSSTKVPSQKDSGLPPLKEKWSANPSEVVTPAAKVEPRPRQAVVADAPLYGTVPDGRIEALEVRPTYVAKEVRITENGQTAVYRKVTHRYGDVHYFCNGSGCSENIFLAETRP